MMRLKRGVALATTLLLAAMTVSACSTTGDDTGAIAADNQPGQAAPLADSSVSSNSLPPIPGASSSTQVAGTSPAVNTGSIPNDSTPGSLITAGATTQDTASTAGGQSSGPNSFVSLNDVGKVSNTPGRNLTGALTVEKLLGGWTVVSGGSQCRLNLTYTAAGGAGTHYRASAPACQIPTLGGVSSWQLAGTQVQLFDGGDQMLGTLLLSGNRFIGTLKGGRAISMAG